MLVGNMLLNERGRLKEFLTCLTPELSFIFLLDVALTCFAQLPARTLETAKTVEKITYSS